MPFFQTYRVGNAANGVMGIFNSRRKLFQALVQLQTGCFVFGRVRNQAFDSGKDLGYVGGRHFGLGLDCWKAEIEGICLFSLPSKVVPDLPPLFTRSYLPQYPVKSCSSRAGMHGQILYGHGAVRLRLLVSPSFPSFERLIFQASTCYCCSRSRAGEGLGCSIISNTNTNYPGTET